MPIGSDGRDHWPTGHSPIRAKRWGIGSYSDPPPFPQGKVNIRTAPVRGGRRGFPALILAVGSGWRKPTPLPAGLGGGSPFNGEQMGKTTRTVWINESVVASSAHDGLASLGGADLVTDHAAASNVGDYQMSRMRITCDVILAGISDSSNTLQQVPLFLVMARADMTSAQVAAALMEGQELDLTPSAGTVQLVSDAHQRGIICILDLDPVEIVHDEAGSSVTVWLRAKHNGPPMALNLKEGSKMDYTFPKSVGWKWVIVNGSGTVVPTSANNEACFYGRYTGRYLDN